MSHENQQNQPSPPPAYSEIMPGAMESELYIDGTLHIDGVPIGQSEKQKRLEKQNQIVENHCKKVFGLVRKLWATQQTERIDRKKHKKRYVRTTIRELIVYMVFLTILSIVVFGMVSTNMLILTQALQNVFINPQLIDPSNNKSGPSFQTLDRMDDFWQYMTDIAAVGFYTEQWYNQENISDIGYILHENRLLSVVQIRQKKVRNNSCVVADDFKEEITFCYNSYAPVHEDKLTFGLCENLDAENCSSTAFKYTPSTSWFGLSTAGEVSVYDQGGFIQILGLTKEKFLEEIQELKDNLWITRGTRAVLVDFTIYNANLNLFCQIQLIFEFPAVGGLITSSIFRTVKLIRYVHTFDYFVLGCEIIFILFILYYTIEEVLEIRYCKLSYFKSIMNCLDIVIIMLSYVCIAFNIYRQVQVNSLLDTLLENEPNHYNDFTFLCYWQSQFNIIISITIFLAWIKVFKYISFNKTMTQLSETLTKCARDISGFAIMFFIIFFAYAQLGYLTFGVQVESFRAFQYSVYTLFLIILGIFDFQSLQQAHRVLGPLFFLTYVFFVFFVLLNMFLAIINDTYIEVKAELRNKKNEFEISDFVKQGYAKMREHLTVKRDRIADIRKALSLADLNRDKILEFDEWRSEMKSRGYAEEEIETIFAKYDFNGDRILDQNEQRALSNDLLRQNDDVRREIDQLNLSNNIVPNDDQHTSGDSRRKASTVSGKRLPVNEVSMEEYNDLAKRLDSMEASVGFVLTKIDNVSSKLDTYEKVKGNNGKDTKHNSTSDTAIDSRENYEFSDPIHLSNKRDFNSDQSTA
ncbi:unnamed protein product [Rotaria magnacalcarata]|uniref:EF-hand domain-containing protein n=3 Tax=Rotaria magnacalcarata TaxID=392030 RepID=A0A816DJZ6_9BILA|nr:unnamed protein product [Rotaria magnacalcarata]CAF1633971.1 unnamed protein product [Rotaria magnacalcarata]CAF2124590.1 unnamed protein product [Rotaria magnacalcarata]CAF3744719.1 unnamed protein product [Rotaria magnacalcarata]CAF3779937.1 unnamed protein product [Rotaria magnacalcarata]